jgi:uncharacterized protein
MKSLRAIAKQCSLLAAILLFLAVSAAHSQNSNSGQFSLNQSPLPSPTGYVNDYAGVIDNATKQQLEAKIDQFKKTSNPSTELAVAVVRTTGDRDIFDYSLAVARGWGIGSKESDNPAALLFIAIDDRKYFTQVSRDLEDELPDGLVGSLQRQYLVPEFKKGNYAKGISDTIDAYIKTINDRRSGVATPTPSPATVERQIGRASGSAFRSLCCFVIIGIIILIIIARGSRGGPTRGDRNRWGGGGFGGAASALPWIIGSVLSSGGGGRSSGSSWGDSGGSSWGGGGGFGGFGGGGDFGGGGAGGSW